MEVEVYVAGPPDSFAAALLARTLYAMLGSRGWRLFVAGRVDRGRVLDESRVPLRVALDRVVFGEPEGEPAACVDPAGKPAWLLPEPHWPLLVDYTGGCQGGGGGGVRVRGLGLPRSLLHYEAVAVLYEFLVRRRPWRPEPPPGRLGASEARLAVKLARRVWDMLGDLDGYSVLKPSATVYIVRKLLRERGVVVDPEEAVIEVSQVGDGVREELRMRAYEAGSLKPLGEARITYESPSGRMRLEAPGLRLEMSIDRLHGEVYLPGGVRVKRGGGPTTIPWSVLTGEG